MSHHVSLSTVHRWTICLLLGLSVFSATVHAQPNPPPKAGRAPAQAEESWPHVLSTGGATVTVYQPQVIAWPEHKTLRARAAISVQPAGQPKPILGTIDVEGATETDLATRSVLFSDPKLIASRFPSLDTEQAMRLDERIKASLAEIGPKRVPLDTVLLSLDEKPISAPEPGLRNEPPTIFYSDRPARLVVLDGEPVLAPVGSTGLSVVVNTNWDLFSAPDGKWYLLDNGGWLTANDYKGPWSPAPSLPASFQSLPAERDFAEVRKSIPGRKLATSDVPTIFVSTVPAELIVTRGPPAFTPIRGTSLRAVSNTDATLISDSATNRFYYLVSGRWFSASGLEGPWTFATPDLPADFARIPPDGPAASTLPSVPGTAQAQEAVLRAQIPQQATLKRATAKLEVTYAGAPQFKPIEGTDMAYAVNTNFDVLKIGDVYYACWQGAWFKASSPTGPWSLADSVPPVIRTIPPSNPLYPVTYVQVYAATPTTVTYGYTAGYMMGFVTAGVLAYGTGYYYPPVVIPGAVPAYFPYPYSYAAGVRYNPYTGAWARGGAVYGPNGGAGAWSAYNPSTGTYAHGSGVWGPYGGTAHASFYNPRYGVAGSTTQNSNAYGRWGSSVVSGPNATVHTASGSNANGTAGGFRSSTGAAGAGVHGAHGNNAGVVRGPGGNVYAGADGNVYRHDSGGWSKWNNNSWNSVQKPTNSSGYHGTASGTARPVSAGSATQGTDFNQLDRDRQARVQGAQRQQQFSFGEGMGGRSHAGGRFR